jgi:adenylyl cyclase-associated protein
LIEDTEINHTVHLFGCKNSVIEIKGKVNAISAGECPLSFF